MKWKNAVDFPNNPYSPEALQRRLSQSSNTLFDIDGLMSKVNRQRSVSPKRSETVNVNLPEPKMDPIRFAIFPVERLEWNNFRLSYAGTVEITT